MSRFISSIVLQLTNIWFLPHSTNLFEVLSSDDMTPDEILEQAQAAAKDAADMLTLRKPKSKVSYSEHLFVDRRDLECRAWLS